MEETVEELETCTPEPDDPVNSLLKAVQQRQNELNEKIKSLKLTTATLKEQLVAEKAKWSKEIQETTALVKLMRHEQIRSMLHLDDDEVHRKLDMFKEYLFFTNTTMTLENKLKKKNYQDWLSEISEQCDQELNRVQDNLTVLKPLTDMASRWSLEKTVEDKIEGQNNENQEKGQGDASIEIENSVPSESPKLTE